MKKTRVLFVLFLITLFAGGVVFAKNDAPKQLKSTDLKYTNFTAVMNSKIIQGKNLLFCSTFQFAWDSLKNNIIKDKVMLSGNPPVAQELNKSIIPKTDISSNSYVSMAGYKKDNIIKKINNALKSKFKNEAPSLREDELLRPEDIIAYAFLYKNLKFANEFESLADPIMFNYGKIKTEVKAFGVKEFKDDAAYNELKKQVTLIYYKNDDEFAIKLNSSSAKDEIILAKIPMQNTLMNAVEYVNKCAANVHVCRDNDKLCNDMENLAINSGDTLQIPKLDFDILHNYKDLENKEVLNKGFRDYVIAKAMQSIRFRLNEKGALLKSEAKIIMAKAIRMEVKTKKLVFDKPFLICLKEKGGKYPYLTIWVSNPEILMK